MMPDILLSAKDLSIDFIDIGCSGILGKRWSGLYSMLNYTGFDPNEEECRRLEDRPTPYRKSKYLSYAISGETGDFKMYKTRNAHCYSLLKPDHKWLKRFEYYPYFEETGEESVQCVTLDDLCKKEGLKADIMKIDSQGMELPILKASSKLLEDVFCIETETGYTENYVNETTFSDIDVFLRKHGFLMMDVKINRVGRDNKMKSIGVHQPIWCEAVWMYDFVGQDEITSREKAIKSILTCKALRFYDYGIELIDYFAGKDIFTDIERKSLMKDICRKTIINKGLWLQRWLRLKQMVSK